jgi:hypothetical protein
MLNTTEKIIKHKTGLLNLAEELGNVSKACQVMGLSRDTFYRYKTAVENGGIEALFDSSGASLILPTGWIRRLKMPSSRRPRTSRLMAKPARPTSCASWECSFRLRACGRSGCGTTWRTSKPA